MCIRDSVYTDKKYVHGHAQIRNSYTTGILTAEENQNKEFNQGIFIDLFVLENVSNDVEVVEKQIRTCEVLKEYIYNTTAGISYEWPEDFELPEELKENMDVDHCWRYIDCLLYTSTMIIGKIFTMLFSLESLPVLGIWWIPIRSMERGAVMWSSTIPSMHGLQSLRQSIRKIWKN